MITDDSMDIALRVVSRAREVLPEGPQRNPNRPQTGLRRSGKSSYAQAKPVGENCQRSAAHAGQAKVGSSNQARSLPRNAGERAGPSAISASETGYSSASRKARALPRSTSAEPMRAWPTWRRITAARRYPEDHGPGRPCGTTSEVVVTGLTPIHLSDP